MLEFNHYKFSELTTDQLYTILALRAKVFIIGQACNYLDPDGKDTLATHLLGTENNELIAYARIFPPETLNSERVIFGRVAVSTAARGKGYGKKLMQQLIGYCESHYPNISIKCSAQQYLTKFYEEFGFNTHGEAYNEENIPHIEMIR